MADLGGQQAPLAFQAAPVTGGHVASPAGSSMTWRISLDGQGIPSAASGSACLIAVVPAVPGGDVDLGRDQQADLVSDRTGHRKLPVTVAGLVMAAAATVLGSVFVQRIRSVP